MSKNTSYQASPWQKFSGPNLGYVMEIYDEYVNDPSSVDPELKSLFDQWGAPQEAEVSVTTKGQANVSFQIPESPDMYSKLAGAIKLADNIRTYGHLAADIRPLNLRDIDVRYIEPSQFDLTEEDLKNIPPSFISPNAPADLKDGLEAINHLKDGLEAINHLRKVYTQKIAFEYNHVHELEEKKWLQGQIESESFYPSLTKEERIQVLHRLSEVEGFEKFIHRTFVGQKRFSIEGLDTLVPLIDKIINSTVESGTKTINIGMAHRGRLNVFLPIY